MIPWKDFKAPYLPYSVIREKSIEFLNAHAKKGELPVEIEEIVDVKLGIDIIPVNSLRSGFDVEAFMSNDFKSIFVDLDIYEKFQNRYRFSLAHEIGHFCLHREIYEKINFSNVEEWKEILELIPADEYSWIETHAYDFAGLVLVPDYHLKENFNQALNLIIEQGYSIDDFEKKDLVLDFVCRYLKDKYQVSEQVIKKRLSKNNIFL